MIILPAVLLVIRHILEEDNNWLTLLCVGGAAVFLAWEYRLTSEILAEDILTLLISAKMYAVILLWGFLTAIIWKRKTQVG